MRALGIDIGGSGIKGALVDLSTGRLTSEWVRIKTPPSFEINAVSKTVGDLVGRFDYKGPVGVGFPAVVTDGVVLTPPTAHEITGWRDQSVNDRFSAACGCDVTVLNDADAAGLAEMRFGAGRDQKGVALVLTLGTGIGSALFVDGKLVPNLELGHIYLKGQKTDAEEYASDRIRSELDLNWKSFANRLDEYLHYLEALFSPNIFILGGGVSKKSNKFQGANFLSGSS